MDYAAPAAYLGNLSQNLARIDALDGSPACVAGGAQHLARTDDAVRDELLAIRKNDDVAEARRLILRHDQQLVALEHRGRHTVSVQMQPPRMLRTHHGKDVVQHGLRYGALRVDRKPLYEIGGFFGRAQAERVQPRLRERADDPIHDAQMVLVDRALHFAADRQKYRFR